MGKLVGAIMFLFALICPASVRAAEVRAFTLRDYLANEAIGNVAVDPTGRYFVWEQSGPYACAADYSHPAIGGWDSRPGFGTAGSQIWIVDLRAAHPRARALPLGNGAASSFLGGFSPDGRFLSLYAVRRGHAFVQVVDLRTGGRRDVHFAPRVDFSGLVGIWVSPTSLVVASEGNGWPRALTGRRAVAEDIESAWHRTWAGREPSFSAHDSRPGNLGEDALGGELVEIDAVSGATRILADGRFEDLRISSDRGTVYARQLVAQRQPTPTVEQNTQEYSVLAVRLASPSAAPVRVSEADWQAAVAGRPRRREAPPLSFTFSGQQLGGSIRATSATHAASLIQWRTNGTSSLGLRFSDDHVELLTQINSGLERMSPGRWQTVSYPLSTPEGRREVEGCLLLPPGYASSRRYPLIVDVYPGRTPNSCNPSVEHYDDFGGPLLLLDDRLLAGQGYAVFQPYTQRDVVQTEGNPTANLASVIDQGVRYLAAQGIIDDARVGLIGYSQGALAALLYGERSAIPRTIIAINGVSDPLSHDFQGSADRRLTGSERRYDGARGRYEVSSGADYAMGASPYADPERFLQNSALLNARSLNVPVLLIHSDLDGFPLDQFESLFTALYTQQKTSRFLIYWGEGHGPSSPANLAHMWSNIFGWADQYLDVLRSDSGEMLWRDDLVQGREGREPRAPEWFLNQSQIGFGAGRCFSGIGHRRQGT